MENDAILDEKPQQMERKRGFFEGLLLTDWYIGQILKLLIAWELEANWAPSESAFAEGGRVTALFWGFFGPVVGAWARGQEG